ncbi:hypothetical protein P7K49_023643 [Saguinus oedipus]|uniref:Uncharacterized protein n=1 Tax=Saguinus oedipus TaxID=9490 RepID=A0ABQ9UM84_SAGOE|nr:hypothetical protein P7K49_023643 [Saguinus oedipus]
MNSTFELTGNIGSGNGGEEDRGKAGSRESGFEKKKQFLRLFFKSLRSPSAAPDHKLDSGQQALLGFVLIRAKAKPGDCRGSCSHHGQLGRNTETTDQGPPRTTPVPGNSRVLPEPHLYLATGQTISGEAWGYSDNRVRTLRPALC